MEVGGRSGEGGKEKGGVVASGRRCFGASINHYSTYPTAVAVAGVGAQVTRGALIVVRGPFAVLIFVFFLYFQNAIRRLFSLLFFVLHVYVFCLRFATDVLVVRL